MNASTQLSLERRAVKLGVISAFEIPQLPQMPDTMLKRFPELVAWNTQLQDAWRGLNAELERALSNIKQ